MPFKRNWDANSCPMVWVQWESDGKSYVIQDLPPEDDELALEILLGQLCADEVLCKISDIVNDPESMASMREFWVACLSQRMTIGCYTEIEGKKTLVALNVCVVECVGAKHPVDLIQGTAWKNVYGAMALLESKIDCYEHMKLDKLLHAYGLVVVREFRGAKLGSKLLMAREPLALHHCVKGTVTVFTGPASQKSAERAGFTTIQELTLKEAAEAGLDYPKTDQVIKLMAKKYCD